MAARFSALRSGVILFLTCNRWVQQHAHLVTRYQTDLVEPGKQRHELRDPLLAVDNLDNAEWIGRNPASLSPPWHRPFEVGAL